MCKKCFKDYFFTRKIVCHIYLELKQTHICITLWGIVAHFVG